MSTEGQVDPARIGQHDDEPHEGGRSRLSWLRAAVLGANDGIVSVASLVVGVAGATNDRGTIALAGGAGLVAGALSMAAGEYVSVSTQRDSERAMLDTEREELAEEPEEELAELADLYVQRGLSPALAMQVAEELTSHDALSAHAEVELGIDPQELTNPWWAALASLLAFSVGAMLPLLVILLAPAAWQLAATGAAAGAALALTGWASARLGDSPASRAVLRNVACGALAMAVTHGVGLAFGATLG